MYYFNARYRFAVPQINPPFSGSIIAASALALVDLQKRKLGKYPHLANRHLDPQLYMASLDEALDPKTVKKLAAYPWFHGKDVPKYDSATHETRTKWKQAYGPQLVSKWTRTACVDPAGIRQAAKAAVELQLSLGCSAILLPGPLTTMADLSLQPETDWIEAGISVCDELGVTKPIFATIAIAEDSLQAPALKNPIVHSFPNQIASRDSLAGAYIVMEQSDPNNYFWTSRNPLSSLLVIIDDLHRGAGKRVVVNYVGTFGLVATAVGATAWSSGYYLSQRRFSRKGVQGRAHPRYHSMALASDIGLKNDLKLICKAGLGEKLMTGTAADQVLRAALKVGKGPEDVPEWTYSQSNTAAAQEHYLQITSKADQEISSKNRDEQIAWVQSWLSQAADYVLQINQKTSVTATELLHQRIWLETFQEWRNYAKQ
jgi:hypothetical protein